MRAKLYKPASEKEVVTTKKQPLAQRLLLILLAASLPLFQSLWGSVVSKYYAHTCLQSASLRDSKFGVAKSKAILPLRAPTLPVCQQHSGLIAIR